MPPTRLTKSWHRKGAPNHYAEESILSLKENRKDKEPSAWLNDCNKSPSSWLMATNHVTLPARCSLVFSERNELTKCLGLNKSFWSRGARKFRDTSDIALGRLGTVDNAANVMLFLASPMSSYVTATCIECTGGRYM